MEDESLDWIGDIYMHQKVFGIDARDVADGKYTKEELENIYLEAEKREVAKLTDEEFETQCKKFDEEYEKHLRELRGKKND